MKKMPIALLIPVLMLSLLPTSVLAQSEGSTWSMWRPSSYKPINQRIQNLTTDDEASVGIGVDIVEYFENTIREPYNNRDGITLKVVATANTRKGITYQSSWGLGLMDWIEANTPIPGMDPSDDNDGAWIDLPFPVRFYGGPGAQNCSGEYSKVWVSSNGFLSFDSDSTSPNPANIPHPSKPNSLLAVYWSDLDPSGGTIKYYAGGNYFVVTWRNVLDKSNGQRQTFEVIIFNTRAPSMRGQNRIEFLYESVAWSASARAGIEDQEGYKGVVLPGTPYSRTSVHFVTTQEAPEIRRITIKLQKSGDSCAEIYPTVSYFTLKGLNLEYERPQLDTEGVFLKALWGYGTLLTTTFVGAIEPVSGFLLGFTLVTVELVPDLARALYPTSTAPDALDYKAAGQNNPVAYVNASAAYLGSGLWPVDALLGDQIEWVFTDNNNRNHSVTVTTELKYYSYTTLQLETITTSVKLSMAIPPPPPGDGTGGCPFVYAWNGSQYVVDNNLLGDSEASSGADVEDHYRLEQSLAQKNGKYELLIKEFEHEHSYIDQIKLMAVNHDSDVRVAVTHRGEILTYKNPHQPISATDNYGNNRLDLVSTTDNNYYLAYPGEYLTLDFGNLDITRGAKLVLRANVEKKPADPGACIHVQVLKAEGWFEAEVLRTRQNWSTQIVDVRGYLPDANGELKIRLYFTGVHRIDYVGLDTTKQDDYQLQTANLVSATHSVQGDVKPLLSEVDNTYAELIPGEQIQLSFTLPNNPKQARTYILYTEGHYYTITQ